MKNLDADPSQGHAKFRQIPLAPGFVWFRQAASAIGRRRKPKPDLERDTGRRPLTLAAGWSPAGR